ncbi:hypothetical protein SCOR_26485 [Sulfidibacter corallicola]|uniref:Uncharacterized protein n=1 Tax=Sulfidibacter corallicola TaxID=2818388 RepID=A0A8A4TN84_SULCO|nr:hypothetical protein [Sulfidibacter corallicola]QTD50897.1 hypothetical protein J3U87_00380 [Sulfidibacter corallicola]
MKRGTPGLNSLCREIESGYGFGQTAGRAYFVQYLPSLKCVNAFDVILFNMSEYSLRYVRDFLLSLPELWIHFSIHDWEKLFINVGPRPVLKWFDDSGKYADIYLLNKYVRVDALSFFVRLKDVPREDRENALDYFSRFEQLLRNDPLDFEDLDGEYFVSLVEIENLRAKLVNEGFSRFDMNEKAESEYIFGLRSLL